MGINNIEKKILESARAEAQAIIEKAEEAARVRLEAAAAGNDKLLKEAVEETRKELEQEHDRQATAARAANKLRLLGRKAEILGDVFDRAVERFIGGRDGEYRKWLSAQLDSVAGETGSVVPAAHDRNALKELLSKKHEQKQAGGLALAEDSLSAPRGGFMLRGKKIDFDLSLDTQLAALKQELLPELAARAFEELTTDEHG